MSEKKRNKGGRNPKLDPAVFRYTVRFSEEEHNRFLSMFEKSGVYAKSVFLKAHFFGQPFKVLKVDKTLVDYYTKLSDFHAQFRAIGTNYNQVVKELRLHFSEKKAMALLYKRCRKNGRKNQCRKLVVRRTCLQRGEDQQGGRAAADDQPHLQ